MRINTAILSLVVAAVIWGATVPIMKLTLEEIPIFSLIVIRMIVASLMLLPFVISKLKIEKADFRTVFLAAIFGTNLNLAFFFFGLEHSQAINGSVILATTPIFTLFFAHIYLKEKLKRNLILGAFLALFGIIVIIGIPVFSLDVKSTIGDISLMLSALAWVGHEIFAKKMLKKYHFLTMSFYTMVIGATIFAPIALLELVNNPSWYTTVTTGGFLGLLYGAVFASFIAYSAWQKGLAGSTASQASFVFYLLPICGIIFSIILLKESFTPMLIAGSLLVALGVLLAEHHRKTKPLARDTHD